MLLLLTVGNLKGQALLCPPMRVISNFINTGQVVCKLKILKHKRLHTRRSHIRSPPSWALWWKKKPQMVHFLSSWYVVPSNASPSRKLGTLTFLATEKWSYSADPAALRDISSRWPLNRDVASCPPSRAEWPPHYKARITRLPNTTRVKL